MEDEVLYQGLIILRFRIKEILSIKLKTLLCS